ncbi:MULTISPECIES: YqzM family protein [Lysinibacillus]|uniref:YqzM family protein n=1 Tax=Lysinibacillus parviboronicapiens TaxID=436516 RepID=A0ABV2PNF3_9BACI|nr:YqzM family protein [Lysinibacillus parviboronicapiens]QDP99467.1 YqzM family protein [Lysinibacillus fusiformis]
MNPFEGKNIQCRRNDAIDSGIGFGVSFAVFAIMFIIAIVVDYAAM